ncbi:MAG: hypothetical protein K1X74_13930 [Pirellulales bacterium]|nr:hypothetical protein [Pirellulales bacterium]
MQTQRNYRVSIVECPDGWEPNSLDDSPGGLRCIEDIGSHDAIEEALEQVIAFNRGEIDDGPKRWAVVFEPPVRGRSHYRVCTPLTYRLVHIHWPEGWQPESPLDVPTCSWRDQSDTSGEYGFDEAIEAARSLNEAHLLEPSFERWTMVVAIECEPLHTSIYCDHLGTETSTTVRRLHVVRPNTGSRDKLFTTVRSSH